ncbi:hypothetical protein [Pseudonocardia sp. ICBG601]|uniref:hypothetical protein n=1 Tax=Pseudonocardia sp. ICBG601 TaxID=2846759 RepID=UPI001CF623A4|nr:hypothetical protein [Pseudonocardia sp. ICBG601]
MPGPCPDPGDPAAPVRAHIPAALRRLNDLGHPDTIAEHLTGLGIRGICGDPGRCAIAAYLDAIVDIPRDAVLYIDHLGWDLWAPGDPADRPGAPAPTLAPVPEHVATFIRRFDRREYPELHTIPGIDTPLTCA